MIMSWIWTGIVGISLFCSVLTGKSQALSTACMRGAQAGTELAIAMSGSLCLWSGVGVLMEKAGISAALSRILQPFLSWLYPTSRKDPILAQALSANFCANLLGLGNAATPMGIRAARQLKQGSCATDELCRLIVMNTASIQLIPANVAGIRAALGCAAPFDILPAVWITSLVSVSAGLGTAWILGRSRVL